MNKKDTKTIKGFRLFQEIIDRSEADAWEEARLEWHLDHIEIADKEDVENHTYTCLCGHTPLKELCFILNDLTDIMVLVGNCCITKFMGELKSNKVFHAVKKKRANREAIELAFARGIISQHEFNYCLMKVRKRKPGYVFQCMQNKILRRLLPHKKAKISDTERHMITIMDSEAAKEKQCQITH